MRQIRATTYSKLFLELSHNVWFLFGQISCFQWVRDYLKKARCRVRTHCATWRDKEAWVVLFLPNRPSSTRFCTVDTWILIVHILRAIRVESVCLKLLSDELVHVTVVIIPQQRFFCSWQPLTGGRLKQTMDQKQCVSQELN